MYMMIDGEAKVRHQLIDWTTIKLVDVGLVAGDKNAWRRVCCEYVFSTNHYNIVNIQLLNIMPLELDVEYKSDAVRDSVILYTHNYTIIYKYIVHMLSFYIHILLKTANATFYTLYFIFHFFLIIYMVFIVI